MEEIKQFVAKRNCETGTTYSMEALLQRSRGSMSSFAISVNTHGSAPCDIATGGQLDVGGLRYRMKMMSLKGSAKKLPQIIRSGGSLNKALYTAVTSGDQPQVKRLAALGKDVNAVVDDQSIISAAAQSADIEMVQLLIDLGASVHTPDRKFGSALASACHSGKGDICELLIAHGASISQTRGKYGCPLSAAAARGHVGIAALLLDHGADIGQRAGAFHSPISHAAGYGQTAMVRFLLDRGADVNHTGGAEGSPLGFAVAWSHGKTAKMLIDCGANVNAPSPKHGSILAISILKIAKEEGNIDMARLLLDAGADSDPPGSHNPLRVAAANADVEAMADVVKLLLSHGASTAAHGHGGPAIELAKRVRNKWYDKKPFLVNAENVEHIDDIIGRCYEVIRLLKEADPPAGRRRSSSSRDGVAAII